MKRRIYARRSRTIEFLTGKSKSADMSLSQPTALPEPSRSIPGYGEITDLAAQEKLNLSSFGSNSQASGPYQHAGEISSAISSCAVQEPEVSNCFQ
jgi:hypothetical protein